MKKYFILLCAAAFAAVACTMDEDSPIVVPSDGVHITLVGNASVETKVSVGEKDGETYPLLWYAGDEISINSKDASVEGAFVGEKAELDSDSSGKASGVFATENELRPQADMELLILYPETMEYKDGTITGSVAATQTQSEGDSSIHVGVNCFSFAETTIAEDQMDNVSFALSQQTAFVKVIVSELTDYSDYCLSGVTLKAEGHSLAGDVSYDVSEKEMTVTNGSETVSVTITNPTKIEGQQAVYFTALPCDLTEEEILLTVEMTKDGETEPVSITTYVTGGILEASYLSVIKVNDNSLYPDWYDPSETRDLMGGWAYGPQNTYFIEQYDGTTPNSITIDVRARGDFSKVKEPKYYALVSGTCEYNGQTGWNVGHKLCYLSTFDENWVSGKVLSELTYDTVSSDYTITVYCFGANDGDGKWADVAIFDEDYNILWSYMIWKYHTGDEPKDVDYGDGNYLLDRIIGAEYGNAMAEKMGTFNPPAGALFQWGRKDPVPYLPNSSGTNWRNDNFYSLTSQTADTGIASSIAEPTVSYVVSSGDWIYGSNILELWGGPTVSSDDNAGTAGKGHKTIYDPCPAGYRVCDANIMRNVYDNGERWETPASQYVASGAQDEVLNPNSPFYKAVEGSDMNVAGGESVIAYKLADDSYDYWPYAGFHYNTTTAGFTSAVNGNIQSLQTSCMYWSSSVKNATTAIGLRYFYNTNGNLAINAINESKAVSSAVRCMKE